MRMLVTGATGFIGQSLVPRLLNDGHEIVAVARNAARFEQMPWKDGVECVAGNIHDATFGIGGLGRIPDVLIHLAWPGLPNYKDLFHFEVNLPADYRFIKESVSRGIGHVLVTGTCLEYGLQNGELDEERPTSPATPYGLAKDTLRCYLERLREHQPFVLQWARLFYMYGPGQNPNSLLAQLDRAIDERKAAFDMSSGEQLRDYLPVGEVARRLAFLAANPQYQGVFNCCSGRPISVRRLVELRLAERKATMNLNFGHYPYPDHEPFAFWGCSAKLDNCLSASLQETGQ